MRDVALPAHAGDGGEAEVVEAFAERALAIAASAAAPNTRRAYATAYRAFALFLRARYRQASVDTFTVAAVAAWRDELSAQGLSPSTVARRVSAVRRLAAAIGADPLVVQVRCTQTQHERPSALSDRELSALLARPDLRATIGVRDRAILELLARGTQTIRARAPHARRRPGARSPTRQAPAQRDCPQARRPDPARVRRQRRKTRPQRHDPATAEAHDALLALVCRPPAGPTDALFVSLRTRTTAVPQQLSPGAVGDIAAKHATAAAVRNDRRTANALRHTFCTMLAERCVALEVIRAFAGHVDIRTTPIYVEVTDQRKTDGIAALEHAPHPLAA